MKYQTKTRVVEAITFDELVEYGRSITPPNHLMNGMPWSFEYKGRHVTHENDTCYLILTPGGDIKMTPNDMLIEDGRGNLCVCTRAEFEASYEPITQGERAVTEHPILFSEPMVRAILGGARHE